MNLEDMTDEAMNIGKDKFVFQHKEKFGKEKFKSEQVIDVNGLKEEEEVLEKVIQGFFRFLNDCGWESEFVLYKLIDIVSAAEESLINDKIEEHPLTKEDPGFMMFVKKVGEGNIEFLKELYDLHSMVRSKN